MISYKKINLLDLENKNGEIFLNSEKFTIKTPIMHFRKEKKKIILILNSFSPNHITFDNILQYISRTYELKNYDKKSIEMDIISCIFYNEKGIY